MKSSINSIKAVIFDLDNTLYDEVEYFKLVFKEFCNSHNLSSEYFNCLTQEFLRIRPISRNIFKDLLKKCNLYSKSNYNQIFQHYLEVKGQLKPYPDALRTINCIIKKNIQCGLLTNGVVQAQSSKVRALGLDSTFNRIVYARQWGKHLEKPHPKPFKEVIKQINVKFHESIFVGDNPDTDFQVPYGYNAFTIRLLRGINGSRPGNRFVKLSIKSLEEIIAFL